MNPADRPFEIAERGVDAIVSGLQRLGASHELHLVDVVDVDAELGDPLRGIDDRGVDPQRAAADEAIRESAQPLHGGHGPQLRAQGGIDRIVGDVAEALGEADSRLIQ
jgi:hypothetical protein